MRTITINDREEMNAIIRACKTCYLAMSLEDQPYVLPMNFALDSDSVILHSAMHGRMWETLQANPKVCINWTLGEELAWQDIAVGCSYRVKSASVIVEGVAEFVEDYDEKYQLMLKTMAQYSELPFKFNAPAIRNVGVIRVKILKISARRLGVSTKPGNRAG
jgi:uncharacterized protein